MMIELRYILLGLGGLVIVVMLLQGVLRHRPTLSRRKKHSQFEINGQHEPTIGAIPPAPVPKAEDPAPEVAFCPDSPRAEAEPLGVAPVAEVVNESAPLAVAAVPDAPEPDAPEPDTPSVPETHPWQEVYIFHISAKANQLIHGKALLACLQALGFKFGDMSIYHLTVCDPLKGDVTYSLINRVKPGTFNPAHMARFTTPGISVFMQLPLSYPAQEAFDNLIALVKSLAKQLKGDVTDVHGEVLTVDRVHAYREELAAYAATQPTLPID